MAQNNLGAPVYITNGTGATDAIQTAPASGSSGTVATSPSFSRSVGSATIATGQSTSSISPAAATQVVAARSGRQSVMISNITGTQPVYLTATASTTGVTTGFFLAAAVGASVTIATSAAIFATSPTAGQTLSYLENY